MRDDRERLLDIRDAIEQIQKYSAKGRQVFEHDLPVLKQKVDAMLSSPGS